MKFIRVGICALVVFGILSHGAVEAWARAVLETGAGLLFLAWTVRFYVNRGKAEAEEVEVPQLLLPLLAFSLVAAIQLIFHRTVSPFHTRIELQLLLAYVMFLFVFAQAFRTIMDWRDFIWFLMSFGFVVAIFGILQHLTFNGKLYWFRTMRYGGIPFGPYVNRNHFAGFAELIIPIALVPLVMGRVRRERWPIVILFALLPIGALFLSASRGGVVSFGAELLMIAAIMALRRVGGAHALAGGLVLLLAFLLVSWLGAQQILNRFSSMQALEVTAGKRGSMRQDTWHIFRDHPTLGTGLGTLEIVYPPYETLYDGKVVNHSHNDYLEALAETGFAGSLICAWFLAVLFIGSLRLLIQYDKPFAAALHLSGLAACTGFLVHSLVDFNLHIPGNALLFFLIAHLATVRVEGAPVRLHAMAAAAPVAQQA